MRECRKERRNWIRLPIKRKYTEAELKRQRALKR